MKQTTIILLTILFASCVTVKKSEKCLDAHPTDAAKYCSAKFPVSEKTSTTTIYKEGKPILVKGETEYVTVNCDSAYEAALKESALNGSKVKPAIVRVSVPVYRQVDTAAIQTVILEKDNAEIAVLQDANTNLKEQILYLQDKVEKADKGRDKWRSIGLWEMGALILILIFGVLYLLGRIGVFKR